MKFYLLYQEDLKYMDRQFEIHTPIGSVVSDSGNHIVDVLTVLVVIGLLFVFKVVMREILRKIK